MAIASSPPGPLCIRSYAERASLLGQSDGLAFSYTSHRPRPHTQILMQNDRPHCAMLAVRAVLDIERAALTEASVPAILKQQALRPQRLEADGALLGRF